MIDVSLSQSFLNPKSVAIIGASADPKKTSSRAQRFLVSHGYKGKIFPVNPNREEIFGLKYKAEKFDCGGGYGDAEEAIEAALKIDVPESELKDIEKDS